MTGTQISDMDPSPTIPSGAVVPFVVPTATPGFNPGNNYIYNLGADLLTRVSYEALALPTSAAVVGSTGPSNVQTDLNARPTTDFLATADGSEGVGFLQSGTDAVLRSVSDKLLGYVDAFDFIPVNLHAAIRDGTSATNVASYIQKAIDSLQATGGTVFFPAGLYHTTGTLHIRGGVNLLGSGNFYAYDAGNVFKGSWIRYRGSVANPALRYHNTQKIQTSSLGIDCGEVDNSIAIWLGSNNAPACKDLVFENVTIFGADISVRWGNANAETPLEQVDSITFRDGACHSCRNGFVVNAANVGDYSLIQRWSFDAMQEVTFDFQTFGFMLIDNCAAGTNEVGHIMFKIASSSPDILRITGCQSEGIAGSKFLTYSATNDQGAVILEGNVINQPIEVTGITKVTSQNNYINSTITLSGFVRWRSYFDNWEQAPETKFVTTHAASSFRADVFNSAGQWFGYFLPKGWAIETGQPAAGGFMGTIVVREGTKCATFVPSGSYGVGENYQPTVDNTYAYRVTVGGTAGAEPSWPTSFGATVTTGAVTFQNVGPSALIKGYGAIAA